MRIIWLRVAELLATTLIPLVVDLAKSWLNRQIEKENLKSVHSTL